MGQYQSLADRLLGALESIECQLDKLLDAAQIYDRTEPDDSPIVLITPFPYAWRPLPDAARELQLRVLEDWRAWDVEFGQLVARLPTDLRRDTDRAREVFGRFIEQDEDELAGVPGSVDEARVRVSQEGGELRRALEALTRGRSRALVVVPDTNALTASCDPRGYRALVAADEFTFLLVPNLLRELDRLKVSPAKSDEFRSRARDAMRRIKGWREQGNYLRGVTVDRTITVRAVATEPRFDDLGAHLDRENDDDRFLATVIEQQRQNPGERFVVVTADTNLQNKCALFQIPFLEPPERNVAESEAAKPSAAQEVKEVGGGARLPGRPASRGGREAVSPADPARDFVVQRLRDWIEKLRVTQAREGQELDLRVKRMGTLLGRVFGADSEERRAFRRAPELNEEPTCAHRLERKRFQGSDLQFRAEVFVRALDRILKNLSADRIQRDFEPWDTADDEINP